MSVWHPEMVMSPVRRALSVFGMRRTWGELLYALVALPQGIFGFVFVVSTLTFSGGLLITFVGLPLLAATNLACRWLGSEMRRGGNIVLGTEVPAPAPFQRRQPGLFGWIGACLRDGAAWRARLYLVLKLPLGIASFAIAVAFYVYGLGGLAYPIFRPFLPCQTGTDGRCHRGVSFGDSYYLDTPFRIGLAMVAGALILLAAPWAVRGIVAVDRYFVGVLLGPTEGSTRVAELERTRAVAVDDSAATLRRIERDLHDGAQARMVAVAMNVGLAREKLAEGGDPMQAVQLLDSAHTTAKQAIVELRDLARGIHPPVLDAGLDAALATLAAHSPVPVEVRAAITERPDPAIETMAYFCAAELLTNVAKHSGARHASVAAVTADGRLRLAVSDDGRGGAAVGGGSGLRGLADRIATVDGRMAVDSPAGGPTTVTVDVPLRAGGAR